MCDKCDCIDWEIAAAQRRLKETDDPLVLRRLTDAIEDLRAEKAALHPQAATENGSP